MTRLLRSSMIACALATLPSQVYAACATKVQTDAVRGYYAGPRAGAPLPVASRHFNMSEMAIASALLPENAVGAAMTPDRIKQLWRSIDAWGAQTQVKLVLAPQGNHSFAFPSQVPVAQPVDNDGFLDVYADGGRGVHAHLQLDRIASAFAIDLATNDPKFRTRGVSFFDADGALALGVYASIKTDPFDQKAVNGFASTWAMLASMPQICR